MGNKDLDTRTNGFTESTYSIIAYPAKELPEQYDHMIRSKWKRTLRYGNEYFKLWASDSFYATYEKLINHYLARPKAIVRLAVLDDDRDIVLGWSLIEGRTLHYVYVQYDQRAQGIAKALIPEKIHYITHLTKAGLAVWNALLPEAVFDPSR